MTLPITMIETNETPAEQLRKLYEAKQKLESQIRPLRLIAIRQAIVEKMKNKPDRVLVNLVAELDHEVRRLHMRGLMIDDLMDQLERYVTPVDPE